MAQPQVNLVGFPTRFRDRIAGVAKSLRVTITTERQPLNVSEAGLLWMRMQKRTNPASIARRWPSTGDDRWVLLSTFAQSHGTVRIRPGD
jgi:uncharacterized circularly permuted ATP-grasp superfamily protein